MKTENPNRQLDIPQQKNRHTDEQIDTHRNSQKDRGTDNRAETYRHINRQTDDTRIDRQNKNKKIDWRLGLIVKV